MFSDDRDARKPRKKVIFPPAEKCATSEDILDPRIPTRELSVR